ncbi:MAG: DUF4199 family protein [Sphingobacteriales bacterium]|uniref:DUF4199 family protein n=1 Tax=Hydrotalea flava TaxID=714549 RepID=UPI00082FFF82|nr:DUF4199 family protein [Hydrotalea flava]RTL53184.1 MAG: DUF4199 family protein [Sphingobacteriales bacterium]
MEVSYTSHIKKGIIIAVLIMLLNAIGQITELIYLPWYGFIILSVFIVAAFISTWLFNHQTKGVKGFSLILSHGFKTVAVATALFFVYNFISMHYLFPHYVDHQIGLLQEAAKQHGEPITNLPDDVNRAKQIWMNTQLAGVLILFLLAGGAGALLAAVAVPKQYRTTTTE